MKDKILFWLDGHLLYFCLAYSLHKKYDANYYALIDVPDRLKKFFNEQEFVEFEKIWFYHDQIITKKDPDLQYLANFEILIINTLMSRALANSQKRCE